MKCPNCGYQTPVEPLTFDIPIGDHLVKVEGYITLSSMSFYLKGDSWEDVDKAIKMITNNEMLKDFRKSVERYFKHNSAYVGIDMYGINRI